MRLLIVTTVVLWSFFALASEETYNIDYYLIKSYDIQPVGEPVELEFDTHEYQSDCTQLSDTDDQKPTSITPGEIINIGRMIWKIVVENRPVVSLKTQRAHALPRGISCWNELESWQVPTSQLYRVSYKNMYQTEVVRFEFRLIFSHGGTLNGKGKYLSNITVLPAVPTVLWGYNFNADVEIPQVLNLGTKESPLAGAEINVNWQVKTMIKESHNNFSFFVDGKGNITQL